MAHIQGGCAPKPPRLQFWLGAHGDYARVHIRLVLSNKELIPKSFAFKFNGPHEA